MLRGESAFSCSLVQPSFTRCFPAAAAAAGVLNVSVCVRVSAGDVIKFPGNLVLPCAPLEPVCARVTRNNARERARGGGEAREESLRLGSKAVRDTASREGRQRQQEQTARGVASQRLSKRERGGRQEEGSRNAVHEETRDASAGWRQERASERARVSC